MNPALHICSAPLFLVADGGSASGALHALARDRSVHQCGHPPLHFSAWPQALRLIKSRPVREAT